MKIPRSGYIGSGGESGYRSSWLLGTICEAIGEQDRALSLFLAGVYQRPAFVPSVAAILRQRVSRFRAEQLYQPLCELVRREPAYLGAVSDFFLGHRVLGPVRRLLQTLPFSGELRDSLQAKLAKSETTQYSAPRKDGEKPGVAIEGSFLILSGHSRINQSLGCRLLSDHSLDVVLDPTEAASSAFKALPQWEKIERGLRRIPARLDLTIRHQWPPDLRRPASGQLACIVPWEHRAVPRAWVHEIERSVDELWVPSRFVADAFIDGGVSSALVRVIPNGFEPEIFHPKVSPWRPEGSRSCIFLFVGGTILRKGADLLLQAYADAFSADDDVTLIFKDTGASSFYRFNNLLPQVQKMRRRTDVAPIMVISEELDDRRLASLYRGSDALVLPYRGEGFGMPLLEAMACGKPVVTTGAGPAPEFCSPEFSYLIPAKEIPVTEAPPPFGEFTREWTWFEPDLKQLAAVLRSIYEHRTEAERKGELAAESVRRTHSWSEITQLYRERVTHLTGTPASNFAPVCTT